jgi:Uma2 family endonuclease
MRITAIILCFIIGCTSTAIQEKKDRKNITIYNNQGETKEHVIVQNDYITIYDKNLNTKGYGKVEKSQ